MPGFKGVSPDELGLNSKDSFARSLGLGKSGFGATKTSQQQGVPAVPREMDDEDRYLDEIINSNSNAAGGRAPRAVG